LCMLRLRVRARPGRIAGGRLWLSDDLLLAKPPFRTQKGASVHDEAEYYRH
jgi:hypothetical protein